ncbi:hypothetical protein QBC47DRAFT_462083 [Echria macrotheca]|uniref:Ubiquitin-like protease family profile domain-containing protein n=1 Tax=Echria macrotheca TaxID=438768 RepID=A0AAJ0F424_9PEZI|nr:hypothetical protein QBC47DRAFT_462083 [Echria macrotheca]
MPASVAFRRKDERCVSTHRAVKLHAGLLVRPMVWNYQGNRRVPLALCLNLPILITRGCLRILLAAPPPDLRIQIMKPASPSSSPIHRLLHLKHIPLRPLSGAHGNAPASLGPRPAPVDRRSLDRAEVWSALLAALRSRSASPGKRKAPEAAGNDAKLLEYDPLDSGIGDSSQADSGSAERSPSRGRSRKRERASDEEGLDRVIQKRGKVELDVKALLERIEARGKLIVLRARAILGEELRHGEAAQRVAEAREMWAEMRDKKFQPLLCPVLPSTSIPYRTHPRRVSDHAALDIDASCRSSACLLCRLAEGNRPTWQLTSERRSTLPASVQPHKVVAAELKRHFCEVIRRKTNKEVSSRYKRVVQVKIPQQTNAIDCGLVPLFFTEVFLLDPEGFIEKATAPETTEDDWHFQPLAARENVYRHLHPLVDGGDEASGGEWASDGDEVDSGDVDDEEVDDGDATMSGETVVNTSAIATGDGKPRTPNKTRQRRSS